MRLLLAGVLLEFCVVGLLDWWGVNPSWVTIFWSGVGVVTFLFIINWSLLHFKFQTWKMDQRMKWDDRFGTGPLQGRAWRKQLRGEPLTPEEQESLDSAGAFMAKIQTPERLQPVSNAPSRSGYEAYLAGDYATAMREFRSSADKGDPVAMNYLGTMYEHGQGVSVNHCEAAQWFFRAAELGHHDSQFMLGFMYRDGKGIPQNLKETIRWWRKAAEQGNSMAQYNLGLMYVQGEGVKKDPLEARQWVEKAAEQGEIRAFCNLGNLYLVEPKDYVRAYMWWTLTIMNGENQTTAAEGKRRIEAVMTLEQIAEAEKLARGWTQKENKIFKDMVTEYQRRRVAPQFKEVQ